MASPNPNMNPEAEIPPLPQILQHIGKKLQSVSAHLGTVSGHVTAQGTRLGHISGTLTTQAVATVVPIYRIRQCTGGAGLQTCLSMDTDTT